MIIQPILGYDTIVSETRDYTKRERENYIYIPKSESNPPKIENLFLTIVVGFCIVVFLLGGGAMKYTYNIALWISRL